MRHCSGYVGAAVVPVQPTHGAASRRFAFTPRSHGIHSFARHRRNSRSVGEGFGKSETIGTINRIGRINRINRIGRIVAIEGLGRRTYLRTGGLAGTLPFRLSGSVGGRTGTDWCCPEGCRSVAGIPDFQKNGLSPRMSVAGLSPHVCGPRNGCPRMIASLLRPRVSIAGINFCIPPDGRLLSAVSGLRPHFRLPGLLPLSRGPGTSRRRIVGSLLQPPDCRLSSVPPEMDRLPDCRLSAASSQTSRPPDCRLSSASSPIDRSPGLSAFRCALPNWSAPGWVARRVLRQREFPKKR